MTRRAGLPLLVAALGLVAFTSAIAPAGAGGGHISSHDGLLAFVRTTDDPLYGQSGDSDTAIWVVRPDGTGLRRLTPTCQDCATEPAWSPDGSQLAYVVSGSTYVIRADGTGNHLLCGSACLHAPAWPNPPSQYGPFDPRSCNCMDMPVWSPDGTRIAFLADGSHNTGMAIGVVSTDGSRLHFLRLPHLSYCSFGAGLDWSPDGTRFVFSAGTLKPSSCGGADAFVMRSDGHGLRRLGFAAVGPRWSPDATSMLYTGWSDNDLHVVELRHARAARLLSRNTDAATWSSDGQQIAATTAKGIQIFDLPTGRSRVVPIKLSGGFGDLAWQHVH